MSLLFVKVNGRNEGTSYVERYSDNYDALVEYAENKDMKLLSDEEYLKLIQKKKEETFYMIEEV